MVPVEHFKMAFESDADPFQDQMIAARIMILVVDGSVVPVSVSLWICLSHFQMKDQRITSYRRRSQEVANPFQLKLLAG
jgi:hypothetical protein